MLSGCGSPRLALPVQGQAGQELRPGSRKAPEALTNPRALSESHKPRTLIREGNEAGNMRISLTSRLRSPSLSLAKLGQDIPSQARHKDSVWEYPRSGGCTVTGSLRPSCRLPAAPAPSQGTGQLPPGAVLCGAGVSIWLVASTGMAAPRGGCPGEEEAGPAGRVLITLVSGPQGSGRDCERPVSGALPWPGLAWPGSARKLWGQPPTLATDQVDAQGSGSLDHKVQL